MKQWIPKMALAAFVAFASALSSAQSPSTSGKSSAQSPPTPSGTSSAQSPTPPPPAPPQPPCSSPEARQFDFWHGEWEAAWKNPDGTPGRGTNRIESLFNGCVTHENFAIPGAQPFVGRSYSVYSPRLKKWQQTWVDSSGGYLDLSGEFADGRMVLVRDGVLGNGKPGKQRMVFYNIRPDAFDWDWESSEDGGRSWTLRWRIHYTRKKA